MPEDKPTAEIFDFDENIEWHWQCSCGNDWFKVLTGPPQDGRAIGLECSVCSKRYMFQDAKPNLKKVIIETIEE